VSDNELVRGHECYHCKQWVDAGDAHDCWTTTEAALTRDLSEDLQDAYQRLRETAVEFGEQRVYASHSSIMFSRKACYFFVRPKRSFLELCIFLRRPLVAPQVKRATPSSRVKFANIVQVRHRDEVEAPLTEWLREAYALEDGAATAPTTTTTTTTTATAKNAKNAKITKRTPNTQGKAPGRAAGKPKPSRTQAQPRPRARR
jgi:hypothetical protein